MTTQFCFVLFVVFCSITFVSSDDSKRATDLFNDAWANGCKIKSHVYDRGTQKCWMPGTKGPCGERMVFVKDDGIPNVGRCECETLKSTCSQPLIAFEEPKRQCFQYFSQGPCKPDEWLIPAFFSNYTRGLICEKNVCLGQKADLTYDTFGRFARPKFFFAFKGKCYVAGTQAFCREDQVAIFYQSSAIPGCYPKDDMDDPVCEFKYYSPLTFSTGQTSSCPDGYEEDSAGDCALVSQ